MRGAILLLWVQKVALLLFYIVSHLFFFGALFCGKCYCQHVNLIFSPINFRSLFIFLKDDSFSDPKLRILRVIKEHISVVLSIKLIRTSN